MKLVWSETALADLAGIRDFIARDSEHYAAGFVQRLIDAVDILQVHPEIGQTVLELKKYEIRHGSKRGQVPLPERPAGCFVQRYLTPF